MKTNKLLLFFVFLFSFFSLCSAQINEANKKAQCNSFMKANYIFEGKIITAKEITVKTGEYTYANYNSYLVEVQKVIKGNIQKGTIEIVEAGYGITYKKGDYSQSSLPPDDGPSGPPSQGLYLSLKETNRMDSSFTNSNAKSLWFWDGIPVTNGKIDKAPFGIGLSEYFPTLSEFYDYISANYEVKIDK